MKVLGLSEADILEECLMIGDRFYDIEAACEVGIDSIGVLYGYGNEQELRDAGATYIAENVSSIVGLVTG